ncbi:MAG: hypothetical protein HN348_07205, partial [Proteobacteria bacterium]|nr:hypothetical protein [Pseudomonadota bacterium]
MVDQPKDIDSTEEMPKATKKVVRPRPPRRRSSGATKVLLFVTLLGALVFFGSIGLVAYLATTEDAGDVKEGSFLKISLSGDIPDAPSISGFSLDPADVPVIVTEIADVIDSAATDERISGLYLQLEEPSAGLGSLREIRLALTH